MMKRKFVSCLFVIYIFLIFQTAYAVQTQQQAVKNILEWTGMSEKQLGEYPKDYIQMAKSAGIIDENFDANALCTEESFNKMQKNAQKLYDEMHKDKKEPLIMNGKAQPIFEYTSGKNLDDTYSNENSNIVRYTVYVETDFDTDLDGKPDLIKVLVQLPKDAVGSDHKFATIYEARPYITGCTDGKVQHSYYGFDIDKMYTKPKKRIPQGIITTSEHIKSAKSQEWYYLSPYESTKNEKVYAYEDIDWYDYFLVRGYAVVEVGGLGTKDSEGFQTCGSYLETEAFKCVVEWLTGDRIAYTDKENNIQIKAEWSNGNVGMTGRSYGGTTQFAVATTGVKGLKAIVPVAGIASWYEYTNSQGITTERNTYTDWLAFYCSGRYLDKDDWSKISQNYADYLGQLEQEQLELDGDYGKHWQVRDYTLNAKKIKCPALIVHGLNDENVRSKHFDLMYKSFKKAGQNVKLLLHQDGHITPAYDYYKSEFYIDNVQYNDILNRWFSHYLYGAVNNIENMPEVTCQSNIDGSWNSYDSWQTENNIKIDFKSEQTYKTINSDYGSLGITRANWEKIFINEEIPANAIYVMDNIKNDITIKGAVKVNINASVELKTNNIEMGLAENNKKPSGETHEQIAGTKNFNSGFKSYATANKKYQKTDGLMLSAMLVDLSESDFDVFKNTKSKVAYEILEKNSSWQGGGLEKYDLIKLKQTKAKYKVIAKGCLDLANPFSNYESSSATKDKSIRLGDGKEYNYTLYLNPNLYTVKKGHKLEVIVFPYDISAVNYGQIYSVKIDNTKSYADIPVENSTKYKDVLTNDWYYNAVEYVTDNNLMTGISKDTFAPNENLTRAMLIQILYNMEGRPEVNFKSEFTDISGNEWYAKAVCWAENQNIISGTSNNQFLPNSNVNKEQVMTILYRYKGNPNVNYNNFKFSDSDNISEYAKNAVSWAVENNIVSGDSKGNFLPQKNANRAEIATIFMRFCNL